MKKFIKVLSRVAVGLSLALILICSSVVSARADIVDLFISFLNGQIAQEQEVANACTEMQRQWKYTPYGFVKVSGDELASLVVTLNAGGLSCEAVNKSITANGVTRTAWFIVGKGVSASYGNFSGNTYTVDVDGRVYCSPKIEAYYSAEKPTSGILDGWSTTMNAISTRLLSIVNSVGRIEDYIDGVETKLDQLHTDLTVSANSPMVAFLQDSYACGYYSVPSTGEAYPSTTISTASADFIVALLNTFMPGHMIHSLTASYDQWSTVASDKLFLTAYVADGVIKVEVKLDNGDYSTLRLCNAYNHYFAVQPDPVLSYISGIGSKVDTVVTSLNGIGGKVDTVITSLGGIGTTLTTTNSLLSSIQGILTPPDMFVCLPEYFGYFGYDDQVMTPLQFNLLYQSLQSRIGKSISFYADENSTSGTLYALYPLYVDDRYYLMASVMVNGDLWEDAPVLFPGSDPYAVSCLTDPDLLHVLTDIQDSIDDLSAVDLTPIESSLQRIETAIEHVTCHHDYRSMLYLDGASVTFESAVAGDPLDDITLQIKPSQSYNGYNHFWVGGQGKNLMPYSTFTVTRRGSLSIDLAPGMYTISLTNQTTDVDDEGCLVEISTASSTAVRWLCDKNTRSSLTFTVSEPATGIEFFAARTHFSAEGDTATFSDIQIEAGSVATSYEPYENIAPISGYTSATVTQNGVSSTIDWASTAGTVYGGALDLATGVLTSTMAQIASYNGETLPGVWYSDRDVYVAGTTPSIGAQVVYVTNNPVTYELTPFPLYTALGSNVISTNCGGVSLRILDGSILTDMGYTLVVCYKCGQVEPLFDYTQIFNRFDSLISGLGAHAAATNNRLDTIITLLQNNLTSTDTEPHEHTYTRHITQDATCTVPGLATYTCDDCGYGYTELLPALGHDWEFTEHVDAVLDDEDEVVQPAYDIYTCTRCDHSYQDYDGTGAPEDSGQISDLLVSVFSRLGNLVGDAINGLLGAGDTLLTSLDQLISDFNDKVQQVQSFGGDYPAWLGGVWDALPEDFRLALSFCLIVGLVGIVGKKLVFTS